MRANAYLALCAAAVCTVACGASSTAPGDVFGVDAGAFSQTSHGDGGGSSGSGSTSGSSGSGSSGDPGASGSTSGNSGSSGSGSNGGACPTTCTSDSDCQNGCPAPQGGGANCCDLGSGVCFTATQSVCPASGADAAVE